MNGNEQESSGRLGAWDAASIIVGIVVGTTIFEAPGIIFNFTPNPWSAMAVWLFGGMLALVGGLCYAELGATYPKAGGDYYYLTHGFGRCTGFLFGWAQLIVILPANIGVMAYVFALQASEIQAFPDLLNWGLSSQFYYAAAAVLGITLLNLLGVTLGKTAQNILSLAKALGLIAILVCGFVIAKPDQTDWTLPATPREWGWGSVALILVMYAYGGWNDVSFVAGEVREPQRNIPRALLFGIGAIVVIYMLVNFAFMLGLGFEQVKAGGSLPARVLEGALGDFGGKAMRGIVMVSALGSVHALIFAGSRVYATLGADHRLFGFLGGWRPGAGSPIVAVLLQALITLGFILLFGTQQGHDAINQFLDWLNTTLSGVVARINDNYIVDIEYTREWEPRQAFGELVTHTAPAFWFFFLLTGFALFRLRDRNATKPRPFSVPWYPLTPMIFCASCVYMVYESSVFIGLRTMFVVVLLLAGLPLYLFSQALGEPQRASDAPSRGSTTSKTVRGS